jgi:predicted MPP superfamily phosphohydrolase
MSKTFSWLHLSDLHIGQHGQHLWPNFRNQFHDDLRYLLQKNGPIQLVVFSGDLTQRATSSEFDELNVELAKLWSVFAEFESKPLLFAVPGNHDLTRPDEADSEVKLLKKWFEDDDVPRELFSGRDNQYLSVVTRCFENYTKWYSALEIPTAPVRHGLLPGDTSCVIEANGLKIGLVGLNSSFIHLSGSDYEGKLLVSPRQLSAVTNGDASTWCNENDFNFLVTHHPSSWLQSVARANFDKEIDKSGRFVAHLYGHMHEAGTLTYSQNGGLEKRSRQASSLFGLEHWGENARNKRIHGYSLNQLDVNHASTDWKMWPRVRMEGAHDDHIAPNQNFHLIRGEEYFVTTIGHLRESTSTSSEKTALQKVSMSSESESQNGTIVLSNSLYRLPPSEHHFRIRTTEQQNCISALTKNGIAWISADWGVGRDGFIWSVLKRLGKEKLPVFRVELGHYNDRNSFLDSFASKLNCSFTDYCRSLANAGPTILLFDEAPTSPGEVAGKHIEEDVESLVEIAKSYLLETLVVVISRGSPKQSLIPSLKLDLLEEPDTRLYLQSQSALISEEINAHFVSQVQRKTEGLIARIDQLIRQLQVVNLADIAPPELSAGRNVSVLESTSISLVKTIAELESSKSPLLERAYLLLQILALLPNGESVHELKHIDPIRPIFSDHALQLYDRDLIDSKSVSVLIGQDGVQSPTNKLMVIPPQVREYVLSRMDARQINKLVKLAADSYFGKAWSSGKHRPAKITQISSQENEGISGNPHSLLLRMLGDSSLQTRTTYASSVLKVCVAYCSALLSADQYRRVVSVAMEMLALIPDEYTRERHAIEINLAKALRMSGQHTRALPLLENLLKTETSPDIRRSLLLNKARCLQSQNNNAAIEVSQEIIKMAPKSADAFQAKSIILEMQDDQSNAAQLLQLERQSRKDGHSTTANNLTLSRVKHHTDPSAIATLRTVYVSATKADDSYNAHRAATKIARFSFLQNGKIEQDDLKRLMAAYHYFYGERFGSLFTNSHEALWEYFETANEVENQLALFRHSSFVWRLNGHEDKEKNYLKALEAKKNEVLLLGERIDKNVLYFLNRAEYQGNRVEDQREKSGE